MLRGVAPRRSIHRLAERCAEAIVRAPARLDSYLEIDRLVRAQEALTDLLPDDQEPETYCLFVGYPRSGHSLIGSLLDAHESVVISHELHVLRCLEAGLTRDQLVRFQKYNAALFARMGRGWSGYDYAVEGQSQGTYGTLRVLGDKRGGGTARYLAEHPDALDRLREVLRWPVRLLHVIRDPLDNVASMARHLPSLQVAAERYELRVRAIARLQAALPPGELLDVHLDEFVADPKGWLCTICGFLGLERPADAYLDACAAPVFGSPRRVRGERAWPESVTSSLRRLCGETSFLMRYADG